MSNLEDNNFLNRPSTESNFQCHLSLRKTLSCLVGVLLLFDVPLVLDVLDVHYLVCPALGLARIGRGWFAIVDWYSQHIVWHIALHS